MSVVADAVIKELQEAVERSKNLKAIVLGSKTNAKAIFYTEKLRKNNEKVTNLLLALDRIEKAKYNMGSLEDNLK